jgi:iron uptake system EfeUOB component EfeO/EfeM
LKDKLQKAYNLYNEVIAKRKYNEPFLEWDGKILFGDKQIKADINSVGTMSDDISKQT